MTIEENHERGAIAVTTSTRTELELRIDRLYVINLESRRDRRMEMWAELQRLDLTEDSSLVEFFPAVRPETAGAFLSIGARGCFMSHLGVLKDALNAGYRAILILEDDAALTPECHSQLDTVLAELDDIDWAIAYLGHRISPEKLPGEDMGQGRHWHVLPATAGVETTHAMLINRRAIKPLITYLEQMLTRPAGHSEGGPMHVDGAYSWFRRHHPEAKTLITPRQYIVQRASKSDIAQPSWKDRLPLVGKLRQLKNHFLAGR
jgi:GR25 family glycosyltransferase involved in LPS biosynthesis